MNLPIYELSNISSVRLKWFSSNNLFVLREYMLWTKLSFLKGSIHSSFTRNSFIHSSFVGHRPCLYNSYDHILVRGVVLHREYDALVYCLHLFTDFAWKTLSSRLVLQWHKSVANKTFLLHRLIHKNIKLKRVCRRIRTKTVSLSKNRCSIIQKSASKRINSRPLNTAEYLV